MQKYCFYIFIIAAFLLGAIISHYLTRFYFIKNKANNSAVEIWEPTEDELEDIDDVDSKLDWAFNLSESYLESTVDIKTKLQDRVILILGFTLSVVAFSIHALAKPILIFDVPIANFLPWIMAEYLVIAIYLTLFGLSPKKHGISGNVPNNLLNKDFFKFNFPMMLFQQTQSYQQKIDLNHKAMKKIAKVIKITLILLATSPLATFLIFYFIYHPCAC